MASAPELVKKNVSMLDGVIWARRGRELLRQRAAVAVGLRVHDLAGLLANGVDDARMAVAGARDRDARGEVEVFRAVDGADHATRARHDFEVGGTEPDVTQMRPHGECLLSRSISASRPRSTRWRRVRQCARARLARPRPGGSPRRREVGGPTR